MNLSKIFLLCLILSCSQINQRQFTSNSDEKDLRIFDILYNKLFRILVRAVITNHGDWEKANEESKPYIRKFYQEELDESSERDIDRYQPEDIIRTIAKRGIRYVVKIENGDFGPQYDHSSFGTLSLEEQKLFIKILKDDKKFNKMLETYDKDFKSYYLLHEKNKQQQSLIREEKGFEPSTEKKSNLEVSPEKAHVLLLEDNQHLIVLMKRMLLKKGFKESNILVAKNITDAIRIFSEYKNNIDIAILDFELPDGKGTYIGMLIDDFKEEFSTLRPLTILWTGRSDDFQENPLGIDRVFSKSPVAAPISFILEKIKK